VIILKDILNFRFYGYTWMECFKEFVEWFDKEKEWHTKEELQEMYPTFESAVEKFYEYINREIVE
jgi:hypothetical protein